MSEKVVEFELSMNSEYEKDLNDRIQLIENIKMNDGFLGAIVVRNDDGTISVTYNMTEDGFIQMTDAVKFMASEFNIDI